MTTTRKYKVKWIRAYQGAGNSTAASDDYDTLKAAWRKADEIVMELGRGARVAVYANGVQIKRNGGKA